MNQFNKKNISLNIIKTFTFIFISMAFVNFLIFGITEYRDARKLILREFKYLSISVNYSLAESIWKNNNITLQSMVNQLLYNYNVSAVKVVNAETKFIESFKTRNGRKAQISYTSDLIYIYDNKKVKVGELTLFTDQEAVFYRIKKTVGLVLLKTLIEVFLVSILIFWAFKKLFTDYLARIEYNLQSKEYIPVDLNKGYNSLSLLEKIFQDILHIFFKLYFKNKELERKNKLEQDQKTNNKDKHLESIAVPQKIKRDTEYLSTLINPSKDFFQRFFSEIFILSQGVKDSTGDCYLFIELKKGRELLLILVDYGENEILNLIDISLILKDIEKELLIKYNINNKLFPLGKIMDFVENKIKSKLANSGVKELHEFKFKSLVLYFDRVNKKMEYTTNGLMIFLEEDDKLKIYNEKGLTTDILVQHKQIGTQQREHLLKVKSDTKIYITSDGVFNQIKHNKSKEVIGQKGFMDMLKKILKEPFSSQEIQLKDDFDKIKGDKPQNDDITIIGVKI